MDGFRAYKTAEGRFVATQEQAGKGATQVVVPYKKADLLAFINEAVELAFTQGYGEAPQPAPRALPEPPSQIVEIPPRTSQAVMEWLLDEATPADVENLFARLGTRFREALK